VLTRDDPAAYPGGICTECRKTRPQRCRYHVLRRREKELIAANAWTCYEMPFLSPWNRLVYGEVPHPDNPQPQAYFRCGFLHAVTLTAADWLAHDDAILTCQPVQEVTLTTWPKLTRDGVGTRHDTWSIAGRQSKVHISSLRFADVGEFRTEVVRQLLTAEWLRVRKWTLPEVAYS
jgi:hypothetical protein